MRDRPNVTPRQREILKLAANGATDKEIASKLSISENVVGNHMHNILVRVNARSRAQAVHLVLRKP